MLEVDLLDEPKLRGGEYYFVNIPTLSMFEWHPFSVSGVSKSIIRFHIQAQASGSWTDNLSVLPHSSIVLNIDGPYGGIPLNLHSDSYESILIIAGGIGLTPYLILLEQLTTHTVADSKLRQVTLCWTFKDPMLYTIFAPGLEELQTKESSILLEVKLYYSGIEELPYRVIIPNSGRLDLTETVQSIHHLKSSVCCLLCGPESLVCEGARCLNSAGMDFHSEVFML